LIDDSPPVGKVLVLRPRDGLIDEVDHAAGRQQRYPLMVELVGDEVPSTIDLADDRTVGHAYVVVERCGRVARSMVM